MCVWAEILVRAFPHPKEPPCQFSAQTNIRGPSYDPPNLAILALSTYTLWKIAHFQGVPKRPQKCDFFGVRTLKGAPLSFPANLEQNDYRNCHFRAIHYFWLLGIDPSKNGSSNCLPARMQRHIQCCICLAFLDHAFANVSSSSNWLPQMMQRRWKQKITLKKDF